MRQRDECIQNIIECRMTKKHDYKFMLVIFCIILACISGELPHKIQKVTKKCPD